MNTLLLRSLVVLTLVVLILAIPIPRGSIELDNKVLIGGYVTASDALKPPVPNGYQTITGSNPASSSPHIEDQFLRRGLAQGDQYPSRKAGTHTKKETLSGVDRHNRRTSAARTRRPAAKNRSASSDAPDKPKPPERTESEDKAFKDPRNASVEELEGLIKWLDERCEYKREHEKWLKHQTYQRKTSSTAPWYRLQVLRKPPYHTILPTAEMDETERRLKLLEIVLNHEGFDGYDTFAKRAQILDYLQQSEHPNSPTSMKVSQSPGTSSSSSSAQPPPITAVNSEPVESHQSKGLHSNVPLSPLVLPNEGIPNHPPATGHGQPWIQPLTNNFGAESPHPPHPASTAPNVHRPHDGLSSTATTGPPLVPPSKNFGTGSPHPHPAYTVPNHDVHPPLHGHNMLFSSATSGYPVGVPPPHSGNFGTGIPTIVGVSGSPHPPPLMSAVNPGEIYVVHHVENPHHTSSEVPTLAGISGPPHPPPPASVVNPGEIYAVHHVDIPHHTSSEIPTSTGVSGLPHPPPPVSAIHHVETPHYPFPQVPQVSDHDNQNFGSTALSLDNHWVAYSQTGHNPNLPTGIGIGGLGTGTGGNHITSHIPVAASPPSSNPYMYDAAGTLPWHGLLHPYPDVTNMGAVTADHHAIGGGMDMWGTGDHHSLATAETLVHIDPHMAALPPLDPHAYLGLEHHSHDPYAIDPSHSGPTASTGSLGMGQHHAMGDVMDDHDHHPLGITGSVGAVHNDIDSQIAALLASDPHSTFALAHHLDKPYAIAPSHGGPTVNTNTGSLALYGPPTMNDPQAVPNTHYTHLIRMRQSPPMGVLPQMQVH